MKYFKVKASRMAERYKITSEEFIKRTERKKPFEQCTSGSALSQFGLCPSCLNPIQLIGINKKISYAPYGRHTGKTIPGLPTWNYYTYKFCPFSKNGDRHEPNNEETLEISEYVIELYDILKNQFDRVVYVIRKELNIDCSVNFWTKALKQYVSSKAYCYPWLTEVNLPYIFAYMGMHQLPLMGQKFMVDTDLYNALCSHSNVKFEYLTDKNGNELKESKYRRLSKCCDYLDLCFRFTDHKQLATDGKELRETMLFCVDDMKTNTTIYEKAISFDETYFINIIANGKEDKRQKSLLDIAEENMPELKL